MKGLGSSRKATNLVNAKLQRRRQEWRSYEAGIEKDDENYEIVDKTYGHNSEIKLLLGASAENSLKRFLSLENLLTRIK
jgi:hypothetical protein